MTIHSLRKAIADAKRLEWLTGAFELSLRNKRAQLHPAIQIPRHHSSDILVEFVLDYIEHTVALIESIQKRVGRIGLEEAIAPAIQNRAGFSGTAAAVSRTGRRQRTETLPADGAILSGAASARRSERPVCPVAQQPAQPFRKHPGEPGSSHQLDCESANQLDTIASRLAEQHLPRHPPDRIQ